MKIHLFGSRIVTCGQADQHDETNFFANAPKVAVTQLLSGQNVEFLDV